MSYKTLDANGDEEEEFKLHAPTSDAARMAAGGRVCGECKHFSLREGQRLLKVQNFLSMLVKEHKWQVHHLGAPPEILGDCGAARSGERGSSSMLTGPLHMACDQWRKK